MKSAPPAKPRSIAAAPAMANIWTAIMTAWRVSRIIDQPPPLSHWERICSLTSESELGGVGEGFCAVDRAHPLTQLRLAAKAASLRNPLPTGEGYKG